MNDKIKRCREVLGGCLLNPMADEMFKALQTALEALDELEHIKKAFWPLIVIKPDGQQVIKQEDLLTCLNSKDDEIDRLKKLNDNLTRNVFVEDSPALKVMVETAAQQKDIISKLQSELSRVEKENEELMKKESCNCHMIRDAAVKRVGIQQEMLKAKDKEIAELKKEVDWFRGANKINEEEIKFSIPKDTEDRRRLLIDLENNVGIILREEKGFLIVTRYKHKGTIEDLRDILYGKDVYIEELQAERDHLQKVVSELKGSLKTIANETCIKDAPDNCLSENRVKDIIKKVLGGIK